MCFRPSLVYSPTISGWCLDLGKRDITWTWIRGHNGDPMNAYADRIANDEAARVSSNS